MTKKKDAQMELNDVYRNPTFRTPYVKSARTHGLSCPEAGRTHQSFQEQCDINAVMAKYERTGVLPDMIRQDPQYGDYASMPSYQESLDIVIRAQEQFNALPAKVRARFANDPAQLLDFVSNSENLEEMYDLGLAIRPEKPVSPIPETGVETDVPEG